MFLEFYNDINGIIMTVPVKSPSMFILGIQYVGTYYLNINSA